MRSFLMRKINNFTKTLSLRAKVPNIYGTRLYMLSIIILCLHNDGDKLQWRTLVQETFLLGFCSGTLSGAFVWGFFPGTFQGAFIRGLSPGEFSLGLLFGDFYPGLFSGVLVLGTFIWGLCLGTFIGGFSRGL